jgi:hypothetical protein
MRRLVTGFLLQLPAFEPSSGHVVFVVDKMAPGVGFLRVLSFPCQFSFHDCSTLIIYRPGLVQEVS